MKYAMVEDGVVTNIAEGSRAMARSWVQLPAGSPAAIGDRYAGGCFFAPDGSMRLPPETAETARQIAALQEELAAARILLGVTV